MQRSFGMLGMVVLVATLALAGCDLGGGGTTTGTPATTHTAGTTATVGLTHAVAHLTHQPTGTADLSWDPGNKTLTVKLNLTGLAPDSEHAAHIHTGTCASGGTALHPFNPNLKADGKGVVSTTQTFNNVADGIPASGWFLNIHNGTGSDVYNTMDIACADIKNSDANTSKAQSVHLTFNRGYGPSQDASGDATLAIESGNKLVVTLHVSGLEPTSTHPVHIHTGSCKDQGAIVHGFPTSLKADGSGNASATVTFDNVSAIPSSGWYVNVHRGENLASPIDFDPITCGDITAS
jgi:hypothetical protein